MSPTRSILIVDHESTIVDVLVEILTDEGYVVYSAPDGAGALAAIARNQPALLFLELLLPVARSAKLVEQVREAVLVPIPIVLMTTHLPDAVPLTLLGLNEVLSKPFYLTDLLACVARYLQPVPIQKQNGFTD